ncbi:MAG: class I SAM-dependent DNA methyltransferase [Clostridia bacterium]|jgi:type I restriction enzyme M protein
MNNEEREIINKTKELIDELKSISENNGIGNSPSEYKIITEVFLYKFLNDKFLYEIKKVDKNLDKLDKPKDVEKALEKMKDDYEFLLLRLGPDTAKLKIEHLISYLFSHKNDEDFYKLFDDTLIDIANFNIDIFSVRTGEKEKIRLFSGISQHITETSKKNNFARAIIDKLVEFSFENLFKQKYDAFAIVFEYLIKDYNKDFGKYAEYYTPNSIARIIARILVKDDEKVENVTVYDPSAGSGTLVLALAHQIGEENCTIYTQDISQKSNEFLRLNLILNNLVHSLGNVVHGNTLTEPAHYNETKTRLAEFDYIVSNPPFKTDFSEYRDELADDKLRERFFAGVPKIPNKDKDKMAIYLMFIQHIIYSLNKKGKAAIVVPTGFLTAQSGIEKKIREKLVEEEMIKGVVSMPSNIFATTGTNVSVLFIDRANKGGKVLLVDAAKLGDKVKDGKNQRTVLREDEIEKIVEIFAKQEVVDDFSVEVTYDQLKEKNCSFSAGQYFEVKIEYVELTQEEFNNKMQEFTTNLDKYFSKGKALEDEIKQRLGELKYGEI